ncbi:unnamed protein product [Cuscuta epithymum]|uniref:Retrotransposon Copia-like N-terminal domain-containing protein n=1 Tax=Cuscuta epithymum TaxID=186058 RepID=A0AAV0CT22_9ASTE|nr:unnamed protein product [Cuscuta epithymum]
MAGDGETKAKDIVIDSMSPYFIQSGDKPGDIHVTLTLRDGNYGDWLDEMSNALYAKNKFGFVNGDIPMPQSDSPYLPYWQRANAMVKGWLNSSMEMELRQSVKFKTAQEIWTDLKERFVKESAPRAYELRCSLSNIRQDGQSISAYFSRLRRVWDEMVSINTAPNCTCGKCSCNISKQIIDSRDRDRLYDFLMGLDDAYAQLKSQILATRPVPTLTAAYHLVSESEQHRSITSARKPGGDGTAFYTQTKREPIPGRRSTAKESRSCSYCGRTNHTYDACFARIGYPPNWNIKGKDSRLPGTLTQARIGGDPRVSREGGIREVLTSNRNNPSPQIAHVDSKQGNQLGISDEQLQKLARLVRHELQDETSTPSSSNIKINMAGLTLEEADWGGPTP